jgi:hypothetical protein
MEIRFPVRLQHGYHAVSLDEQRKKFPVSLWDESDVPEGQTIDQTWFAGVHSDVPNARMKSVIRKLFRENVTGRGDSIPDPDEMGSTRMAVCPLESRESTFWKLTAIIGLRPVGTANGFSSPEISALGEFLCRRSKTHRNYCRQLG